jgi:hypothetical protein
MFKRLAVVVSELVDRLPANPYIRLIALLLGAFAAITAAVKSYKELFPAAPMQASSTKASVQLPKPIQPLPSAPSQADNISATKAPLLKAPPSAVEKNEAEPLTGQMETAVPAHWNNPSVRMRDNTEAPVAYCLWESHGSESGCGQAAADAFCQNAKLARAISFSYRLISDRMQLLYFYGSNVYSYSLQYDPKYVAFKALTDVTCE